jgi:hypothetical protein
LSPLIGGGNLAHDERDDKNSSGFMIPDDESGRITSLNLEKAEAPALSAAETSIRSIRIMLLKIGPIINNTYRCTIAKSPTAKSENKNISTGLSCKVQRHQTLLLMTLLHVLVERNGNPGRSVRMDI